jgi:hypothetical protein
MVDEEALDCQSDEGEHASEVLDRACYYAMLLHNYLNNNPFIGRERPGPQQKKEENHGRGKTYFENEANRCSVGHLSGRLAI